MAPNIRMSVWVSVGVRIALLINLSLLSENLVVYYCRCCNVICYATRYLFVNTRYPVAASNAKKKQRVFFVFRNNFVETQVSFY